jgi:toxin ParE1/3/4
LKPFLIHAEAEAELLTAVAHYETQLENLGGDFRGEFEAVLERIQSSPQTFKAIDDQGTRKVRLRRFPYTIYYVELDDSLWIAAVAHQKRRPGYWSDRRVEIEGTR